MITKKVALSEIDLKDTTYLLSDVAPDQKLIDSITDIGLLNPVKLIKKDKNYIVLAGWKRIHVLLQLGNESVYSQIYENDELLTEHICVLIYTDNKERITDLEKAELLKMISNSDYYNEKNIVQKILPVFGLNPTLNNLKKYISIASLKPELKKACMNEELTIEQLKLLSEIDDPEFRDGIYNYFLKEYKFNNNETRDLIKELNTISKREKQPVEELAQKIYKENNGKADKNTIRKTVKIICYPKLTKTELKYNELVKNLNLGNSSRLVNHPYFESNEIELRIKIKEKNDLIEDIEKLKASIVDGRVDELLKLIKEGN